MKIVQAAAVALLATGLTAFSCAAKAPDWDGSGEPGSFAVFGQAPAAFIPAPAPAPEPKAADKGLVIDAVDVVMARFHRYDNKVHPYGRNDFWRDFVAIGGDPGWAETRRNPDGTLTIEFSNLEDLLGALVRASRKENAKIAVLNINAHGLPGGNIFPRDEEAMDGDACQGWMQIAQSSDLAAYREYYSPVDKGDIEDFRMASAQAHPYFECLSGAGAWKEAARRVKGLSSVFAPGAQVHFDSCLTGLGKAGEVLVQTVAQVLFPDGGGNVVAAADYGLSDGSMANGMGFWDYQNDAQLERFNEIYPRRRQDSEFAQPGTIRVAVYRDGAWTSVLLGGLRVMPAGDSPLFTQDLAQGAEHK